MTALFASATGIDASAVKVIQYGDKIAIFKNTVNFQGRLYHFVHFSGNGDAIYAHGPMDTTLSIGIGHLTHVNPAQMLALHALQPQ